MGGVNIDPPEAVNNYGAVALSLPSEKNQEPASKFQRTAASGPAHLESKFGRILSFCGVVLTCAVASGPVAAWPTLEPLLAAEGVFQENAKEGEIGGEDSFNAVYGIATVVMLASSLPAGIVFDKMGANFCGWFGALGAATSLGGMSLAAAYPAKYDWVLFVAYPGAMTFGILNTYSMYAFVWLLPENQNLVTGIATGVSALSDMFALLAAFLYETHGMPLHLFFAGLAVASALAAVFCALIVPQHEYIMRCAEAFAEEGMESAGGETEGSAAQHTENESLLYDMPTADSATNPLLQKHPAPRRESKLFRSYAELKRHAWLSGIILAFSTVYCLSMMYPIQEMYFYYEALWPTSEGEHETSVASRLVNNFALVYGVGGFFCAVLGGMLCDSIGVCRFTVAVALCALSTSCIIVLRHPVFQIMAQIGLTLGFSLYSVVLMRYSTLYAPPDIFGTFTGLLFTYVSIAIGVGAGVVEWAVLVAWPVNDGTQGAESARAQDLGLEPASVLRFKAPFLFLGVLAAFLGIGIVEYWRWVPPPGEIAQDEHAKPQLEEIPNFDLRGAIDTADISPELGDLHKTSAKVLRSGKAPRKISSRPNGHIGGAVSSESSWSTVALKVSAQGKRRKTVFLDSEKNVLAWGNNSTAAFAELAKFGAQNGKCKEDGVQGLRLVPGTHIEDRGSTSLLISGVAHGARHEFEFESTEARSEFRGHFQLALKIN
mmetsp:Transcript_42312/g.95714  ORF Transcript_42312/g.95714 Transcript_42312/m.95714 type:complete len:716 (-) Transcript_42312:117-2264(-)